MSTATYKNAINDVVGQIKVIHKKAESIKKSLGECLAYWDVIDNAIPQVKAQAAEIAATYNKDKEEVYGCIMQTLKAQTQSR